MPKLAARISGPVSYTHLDVYKRHIDDNESVPSEVLVSVQDGQLKVEVK